MTWEWIIATIALFDFVVIVLLIGIFLYGQRKAKRCGDRGEEA